MENNTEQIGERREQAVETNTPEETAAFGQRLAGFLESGMAVALYGELGSGKTEFARGIAKGLGINEPVTSPTFNIIQEYRRPLGDWLYHLDLYRVPDEESAMIFGIDEYLFNPQGITLIEWPENIEGLIFQSSTDHYAGNLIMVYLEHVSETSRKIKISKKPIHN